MQVEVEERAAALAGNPVQLVVQAGEHAGELVHPLGTAEALVLHRRAVDALQHQPVLPRLEHARNRIAVGERALHDPRLAPRVPTRLEPAQDTLVVERVDLGGASLGEELHAGSSFSTYFASTSASRLTSSPGARFPSVVTSSVCGTSATSNALSSRAVMVSATPSTVTEPFSTQ